MDILGAAWLISTGLVALVSSRRNKIRKAEPENVCSQGQEQPEELENVEE